MNLRKARLFGATMIGVAIAGGASPALAQQASGDATVAPTEEVIVTANRHEEQLSTVPMSVSALNAQTLQRDGSTELQDYLSTVPSASGYSARDGETRIVLRGINSGGTTATTAIYIDETPYTSSSPFANGGLSTPDIDTYDLRRVEVLRGPQGTLYGASSLGGLVTYVTTPPDLTAPSFGLQAGVDSVAHSGDNGGVLRGLINIPLSSSIAFRASGYVRHDAGYVDDPLRGANDINGIDTSGGRASLLFEPSGSFSLRLTATLQDQHVDGSSLVDVAMSGPNTVQVPLTPVYGPYEQGRFFSETVETKVRLYNATANWDLGWANLVSSTSLSNFNDEFLTDASLSFFAVFNSHVDVDKFTQEFRLASEQNDHLEWMVGAFYTDERPKNDANFLQDSDFTTFSPNEPVIGTITLHSKYKEEALFGDVTYHFSPAFDVALGARFAHNQQDSVNITNLVNLFGIPLTVASGSSSETTTTWSVSPRWHLTDNSMLYARIATGYRPGGPNALPFLAPPGSPTSFDADTLINYEAGFKADFPHQRASIDLSVFYIDWSKIQLDADFGGLTLKGNGGHAVSQGAEASIDWSPIQPLSLSLNASYVDAHLTQDTNALINGHDGDPLPNVPKWNASFSADYRWEIGSARPYVGLTGTYAGKRSSDFNPFFGQVETAAYTTLDLRAGVDFDHWSLQFFARNVTDERGIDALVNNFSQLGGGSSPLAGGNGEQLIRPRTIGMLVSAKF